MPRKKSQEDNPAQDQQAQPEVRLVADEQHPDFVPDSYEEAGCCSNRLTPVPDGPSPLPPLPQPPFPLPVEPVPLPRPFPPERPWPPIPRLCPPVSGRYAYYQSVTIPAPVPLRPGLNSFLILFSIKVRVDVDRFYPQRRISIEASRRFPRTSAHVIAEVTSDRCLATGRRRIEARITYRDGDASLLPGDTVVFETTKGPGFSYGSYTVTISGGGAAPQTYALTFESQYFDDVEFEVDCVANAGAPVTTYDTGSHPNRPASLPAETISLATVYQRAGFNAVMSPNTSVIPVADAGANGTWSDQEMHNAMVTYWSRFADRPQWAMWVLFAARHDMGRSLGGIMFDDIGPNHRQGTAIFTDSFIQDAPAGDPNPAAWRRRMVFWTAAHEMGHGFNLAHSWQKSLGTPWIPLANEPLARSFMNYPYNVPGGESAFFSDFAFRFSDNELVFLRHAPRRFVQMGNANWFDHHAFEQPSGPGEQGRWALQIRPNRDRNSYNFLEPVMVEFKLTNRSGSDAAVDEDLLAEGRHISFAVQREGGVARVWKAMIARCHEPGKVALKPGQSMYGVHPASLSTEGWVIDEPGFYKLQAAVDIDGEIVVSNVLRVLVGAPANAEETALAPDYFTEDVARTLVFGSAPALPGAAKTLEEVAARCPRNPASIHAARALTLPRLRQYKRLEISPDRTAIELRSSRPDVPAAAKALTAALLSDANQAAQTLGHIEYFRTLDHLSQQLAGAGNPAEAKKLLQSSVSLMKSRAILQSVIEETERKLARIK